MNIEDLLSPAMQEKIRYLVGKVMIEKNMIAKEVLAETKITYTPYFNFLKKGKLAGEKVVRAFAYFVVSHGYKLEEDDGK
jgi:hypothetical protein